MRDTTGPWIRLDILIPIDCIENPYSGADFSDLMRKIIRHKSASIANEAISRMIYECKEGK